MRTILTIAFILIPMSLAQAQETKQGAEPKQQQDESDYYDTSARNKGTKQGQPTDPKKAEPDYGSSYYSPKPDEKK